MNSKYLKSDVDFDVSMLEQGVPADLIGRSDEYVLDAYCSVRKVDPDGDVHQCTLPKGHQSEHRAAVNDNVDYLWGSNG